MRFYLVRRDHQEGDAFPCELVSHLSLCVPAFFGVGLIRVYSHNLSSCTMPSCLVQRIVSDCLGFFLTEWFLFSLVKFPLFLLTEALEIFISLPALPLQSTGLERGWKNPEINVSVLTLYQFGNTELEHFLTHHNLALFTFVSIKQEEANGFQFKKKRNVIIKKIKSLQSIRSP